MLKRVSRLAFLALALALFFAAAGWGQASGTIEGVVKDPSGGVVSNAKVEISYAVSGYQRQFTTGADGTFRFTNVPFNTYHMVIAADGFDSFTQDVDVRTVVPVSDPVQLKVKGASTSVTVEANGGDLVENEPGMHIKPSNTVLRVSYARIMETPFNENLVIASTGCSNPMIVAIVSPPGVPCTSGPLTPGLSQ